MSQRYGPSARATTYGRPPTERNARIERSRAKGRHLLIDDQGMIDAYAQFLESGAEYPSDEKRGIWFPESLRRMSAEEFNADLSRKDRFTFSGDCFEMTECPSYRERGW